MNLKNQREGWLWESRLLIAGIAISVLLAGTKPQSEAEETAGNGGTRSHRSTSTRPTSAKKPPLVSTPVSSQHVGFHPDFNREAHRDTRSPLAAGGNRILASEAEKSAVNSHQSVRGRVNAQQVVWLADKSKERKEKPSKPEPKPKVEKPDRPEKPKQTGNEVKPPKVLPNHQPSNVKPKTDKPPQTQRPEIHRNPGVRESIGNDKTRNKNKIEPQQPGMDKPAASVNEDKRPVEQKIRIRKPGEKTAPAEIPNLHGTGKPSPVKIRESRENTGAGVPKRVDVDQADSNAPHRPPRIKDGQTLPRDQILKTKREVNLQQSKIKDGPPTNRIKLNVTPELKRANAEQLKKLPREQLKLPVAKNGKLDPSQIARLKPRPAQENFNERLRSGDLNRFSKLKSGHTYQMHRQFALHQSGDISRRMNLLPALHARGGWRHRHFGVISPFYAQHCRAMWYAGPAICGPYLWYPRWRPWVDWCWWDTCSPIYDPRPIHCRPVHCDPCSPWVAWRYPVWQPLPAVSCGTWVDVDPVVINNGLDVQLLATRFVDPGHPEQELGPRFRVWFRNNGPFPINQPFNVLLIASTDGNAYAGLPESGVRVPGMAAGETQSVDIRLPFAANFLDRDAQNRAIPFNYLNVFVDAQNELPEAIEANNGATLVRGEILPVDPVIFAADPAHIEPTGIVHLAGEGFGPEPGKALIVIGDQEFEAEILGWFDLGVQIRVPDFALDEATAADLVIVRGDGAASQPLTIEIDPAKTDGAYAEPEPAPLHSELPAPPPLPE